ncbi:uncharacterized protein LOC144057248 [Vanacampus margaritifer]
MKINVALGLLLFCAPLMTGGANATDGKTNSSSPTFECYRCANKAECTTCLQTLSKCPKSGQCASGFCFNIKNGEGEAIQKGCKDKEDCEGGGTTCCKETMCNGALAVGGMPLLVPLLVPLLAAACLALFK